MQKLMEEIFLPILIFWVEFLELSYPLFFVKRKPLRDVTALEIKSRS